MKYSMVFKSLVVVAFICFQAVLASACSALLLDKQFLGRNLDWDFAHGLVIVNARGLHKTALIGDPYKPATWTSRYGSVTFNQVGRELPYGGVNEKGLDVEALWLRSAEFPDKTDKPAVNELQWVQYQLDNFASVKEVIDQVGKINPIKKFANLHYFVCDAGGACAAIEPIAGRLAVSRESASQTSLLTNDTFADSVKYAAKFSKAKAVAEIPGGTKSLDRFARLKFVMHDPTNKTPASFDTTFDDLSAVASHVSDDDDGKTQWSVVSDLKNKIIRFKTAQSPSEKTIRLASLDFSCGTPLRVLDISIAAGGEVSNKFTGVTHAELLDFATKSLVTGFAHMPAASAQKVVAYSDSLQCAK